jgi:hypothetical protein
LISIRQPDIVLGERGRGGARAKEIVELGRPQLLETAA